MGTFASNRRRKRLSFCILIAVRLDSHPGISEFNIIDCKRELARNNFLFRIDLLGKIHHFSLLLLLSNLIFKLYRNSSLRISERNVIEKISISLFASIVSNIVFVYRLPRRISCIKSGTKVRKNLNDCQLIS